MKKYIVLSALYVLVTLVVFSGRAWANPQIPSNDFNPADFSTNVTNKYFTLRPGTTYNYRSQRAEGTETNKMVVTNLVREVNGVKTIVVWDRVWMDGSLIEETYDWYAQDKIGNVWYFGEESREYEDGKVSSTKGSWESGINGAKAGIIFKANPKVGDNYYQEYYKGEAEDQSVVLALNQDINVPAGKITGCVKTSDFTNLAIDKKETKYYCPGTGQISLTVNDASGEKDELVSIQTDADFVGLNSKDYTSDLRYMSKDSDLSKIILLGGSLLIGVLLGFVSARPSQFQNIIKRSKFQKLIKK